MKTIIALALLMLGLSANAQTNTNVGCIQIVWDDPNPALGVPVDSYKLYHSTNLTIALTNWSLIATTAFPATNGVVLMPDGTHYFYMTPVNFWGEGPPSNVFSTNTPSALVALVVRLVSLTRTNSP